MIRSPFFHKVIKTLTVALVIFATFSVVHAAVSYQSDPNTTTEVNEHGVCKKVVNTSLLFSYFIPANSPEEWSLFRSAVTLGLGGLSLDECIVAPPPDIQMNASPDSIASGATTKIFWSTAGATSCVASGDWSGSKSVNDGSFYYNETTTAPH